MHLLLKIHVAGAMYKVFCQKFRISMRTIQDFSIVTISEFVLLANRCDNYGLRHSVGMSFISTK